MVLGKCQFVVKNRGLFDSERTFRTGVSQESGVSIQNKL